MPRPYTDKAREYNRQYYLAHRDERREDSKRRNKEYYAKNKEALKPKAVERYWERDYRSGSIARRRALRQAAIEALGPTCTRCGHDDIRALEVHHVNGGGPKEVKRLGPLTYWRHVANSVGTGLYEVLCANCHTVETYHTESPRIKFSRKGPDSLHLPLSE